MRLGRLFLAFGLIGCIAVCAPMTAAAKVRAEQTPLEKMMNQPKTEKYKALLAGKAKYDRSARIPEPAESNYSTPDYSQMVDGQAKAQGLPYHLVLAVIKTESDFNSKAVSPKGAMGLMQLMPETARLLGVTDPFDPVQNVRGGCLYLRQQLARFNSIDLALAAYNAGPEAVEKYGGIPPYEETQNYVKKVNWYYGQYIKSPGLEDLPGIARSLSQAATAMSAGMFDQAVRKYREALKKYPDSAEASFNLAWAYDRSGQTDQAIRQYYWTMKLDPYYKKSYEKLAALFEAEGQYYRAIFLWRSYRNYIVSQHETRQIDNVIARLERRSQTP